MLFKVKLKAQKVFSTTFYRFSGFFFVCCIRNSALKTSMNFESQKIPNQLCINAKQPLPIFFSYLWENGGVFILLFPWTMTVNYSFKSYKQSNLRPITWLFRDRYWALIRRNPLVALSNLGLFYVKKDGLLEARKREAWVRLN